MILRRKHLVFFVFGILIGFSACGKKKKTHKTSVNLSMNVVHDSTESALIDTDSQSPSYLSEENLFRNVMATGSGLKSLKMLFTRIAICKDVTFHGTAREPSGCLSLYQKEVDNDLVNTLNPSVAIAKALTVTEGYIDVMDPQSLAVLKQSAPLKLVEEDGKSAESDAGEYNWGVVEFALPIKVTASLVDPSDTSKEVLFTKPSSSGTCRVNNNPEYACAIATSALTSSPAEEATFASGAGVAFKFQKPLVISEDDIKNGKVFNIKIAFNPNGLLQGVTPNGATNFPPYTDNSIGNGYNLGNTLALVGAQFSAVFHESDAKVMRETYLATIPASGGNGSFDLRVEMYFLDTDPDRTIYGVSVATLPTADFSGYLVGYQTIKSINTGADGSIDLIDILDVESIKGLKRLMTVGETTSAQLACDSVTMSCNVGQHFTATFKLIAYEELR